MKSRWCGLLVCQTPECSGRLILYACRGGFVAGGGMGCHGRGGPYVLRPCRTGVSDRSTAPAGVR